MGTSSARRGPTTALWRSAKAAATRYLSPEAGSELNAREVVARYLAALEETPGLGERLAVFRFTRKVGQELGAFWEEINSRGLEQVLQARDLAPLAHGDALMLAQGLSAFLAGSGGGLEESVARTSLALVLRRAVQSEGATPAHLVRQFLAIAFYQRLALDLGEPLETAAGSFRQLKDGLSHIKALVEVNVLGADRQPEFRLTPEHWQGLSGWTWVTKTMTALMAKLEQ
jgi:hypothetical protein